MFFIACSSYFMDGVSAFTTLRILRFFKFFQLLVLSLTSLIIFFFCLFVSFGLFVCLLFVFIYFYQLEANYFTILQGFLSYSDMNQPWMFVSFVLASIFNVSSILEISIIHKSQMLILWWVKIYDRRIYLEHGHLVGGSQM